MDRSSYCNHGWVGYGKCPQCDPYKEIERLRAALEEINLTAIGTTIYLVKKDGSELSICGDIARKALKQSEKE